MARLTLYVRFFYLLLRTTTSAYIYSSRIYIPEFRPHDAARLVGAQSCIPMNSAKETSASYGALELVTSGIDSVVPVNHNSGEYTSHPRNSITIC